MDNKNWNFNKERASVNQAGQTLVETMVAAFILVMGITAAIGLALYSFNASTAIRKQVIGMGLARQGLETVRNMRDTNWLHGSGISGACNCHTDWLDAYYDLQPSGGKQTYVLSIDQSDLTRPFVLTPQTKVFAMDYDGKSSNGQFYYPNTGSLENAAYFRKITLSTDTSSPYDSTSPKLTVRSQVWWSDKKCQVASDFSSAAKACRIQLDTYLTNWKTF